MDIVSATKKSDVFQLRSLGIEGTRSGAKMRRACIIHYFVPHLLIMPVRVWCNGITDAQFLFLTFEKWKL